MVPRDVLISQYFFFEISFSFIHHKESIQSVCFKLEAGDTVGNKKDKGPCLWEAYILPDKI